LPVVLHGYHQAPCLSLTPPWRRCQADGGP
jgi:hypothetical protein